jgi:hypothetical protein
MLLAREGGKLYVYVYVIIFLDLGIMVRSRGRREVWRQFRIGYCLYLSRGTAGWLRIVVLWMGTSCSGFLKSREYDLDCFIGF